MKTTDNTVLITGGSSGIGLALAKSFIELKNKVIVTGRHLSKLEAIKNEIPEIFILQCELTDPNSLNKLVVYIEQNHSNLNILINNAAVQYNYNFIDRENIINKIDYEISANLNAPIKLTTLLLPTLLKNNESAIVNVSSGLAISPKKSASVYCATKAAIHSFTKTLRYQLNKTSVKVFEIIPPLTQTPMTEGRGRSKKMTPEHLASKFIKSFKADKFESYIGKSELLRLMHRLSPKLTDKIMRNGI